MEIRPTLMCQHNSPAVREDSKVKAEDTYFERSTHKGSLQKQNMTRSQSHYFCSQYVLNLVCPQILLTETLINSQSGEANNLQPAPKASFCSPRDAQESESRHNMLQKKFSQGKITKQEYEQVYLKHALS